jgi:hypothetical protein
VSPIRWNLCNAEYRTQLCFLSIPANPHQLPEQLATIPQSLLPDRYPWYEIEWIGCADN